ncbi:MAG: hypothetical protein A4E27_00581 [Methanobacterium sp. PtaU1.Bin242]|nr:MAG: hypothetical protein A4E27_00581 [Methanobacterium sp. PtaU1.Bin242]
MSDNMDISKYFNSIKVDVKSDLDDWESLKKELYKKLPPTR